MANRRIIVKRRKTVRNIRKITRTMQLIATARFQAAYNRAIGTKPYTEKLAELVDALSGSTGEYRHPLMQTAAEAKSSAMVIITSNRGLCGAYNSNVLRTAIRQLDESASAGISSDVSMVGKKGVNFFRFLRREMAERITNMGDAPRFEQIEPIANGLMERFLSGRIASAHVAYMKFLSIGQQKPTVLQLLPMTPPAKSEKGSKTGGRTTEFEFSPAPKELLDELLPATVRVRLFQAFTDAAVCEQIARMVAMKAATDAAGEMITALTRQYNRARQTHITMELLDIVGGANALA